MKNRDVENILIYINQSNNRICQNILKRAVLSSKSDIEEELFGKISTKVHDKAKFKNITQITILFTVKITSSKVRLRIITLKKILKIQ